MHGGPLIPVILAGGIGARLAPISTPDRPKPFVPLADGESLLTKTCRRVANPALFQPPILVGRAEDRFALLNHARSAQLRPGAILVEPMPQNTAMAVAVASAWAAQHYGPDAMLVVVPADHWLPDAPYWQDCLARAAQVSRMQGQLCLLGAVPTKPDPAYGYMEPVLPAADEGWFTIRQFIEKPAEPQSLIQRGSYWNMGQFVGTAGLFQALLRQYAPAIAMAASAAIGEALREWEFTHLPLKTVPAQPFDRAVVEKASCVALRYDGEWEDMGTVARWVLRTGLDVAYYQYLPPRTDRPWGYFELLAVAPGQQTKRLVLFPGCRLSRQRHHHRQESWRVLAGVAEVECEEAAHRLQPNQEITIPAGAWHRLANYGTEDVIIEEIQFGDCSEHDIERAEDDYGRV